MSKWKRESWRVVVFFLSCYGLHSRALLKPLEAGYLSYYVIRLAGTPNESFGNLSALWIAPSPTTIHQLAPHLTQSAPRLNTHIYNQVAADVDGLGEMDRACNGIPMLNTPLSVFCHLGWTHYSQPNRPKGNDSGLCQADPLLLYNSLSWMELSPNIYLSASDKKWWGCCCLLHTQRLFLKMTLPLILSWVSLRWEYVIYVAEKI